MQYDSPRLLDSLCFDMLQSEYVRGSNRARIAKLANGAAPYTAEECAENNVAVNINDLTHTRLLHDARTQFGNAFNKTGFFSRATLNSGPERKRDERSRVVTRLWNRPMKRSLPYYESLRAKFGLLVLHGISPSVWENTWRWCPKPLGVEDVLMPGETLLGFENLPFFAIRRSFTGIELAKLTRLNMDEKPDPGWNMPFVKRIMKWMDEQATMLRSMNWPDVWAPEKIQERNKEETGGFLAGDRAPRIDVFDIYCYDDSDGKEGWVRRMILDSWSEPSIPQPGGQVNLSRKDGTPGDTNGFLYTSKKRKVAMTWQEIISFQFADLSAVFPARYHSVRGLGWMLYAPCHLGMRLRCKFYESVLEALMMLYEVDSQQDVQNALKLNLINKGFIDKTIRPVPADKRWQVNAGLVELGMRDIMQVISENSAAWTQNQNFSKDRTEKTRFQVMAEMQAMTALVSAALAQAYMYQAYEYREIFRRFCKPNSKDPDVRSFRAACLREDVPVKYLDNAEYWDVEAERITGGGNKTLEMQIADWLMQNRPAFDPEPQRDILRKAVLAYTDDASTAISLVPEAPQLVTSQTREAEHIAATLMSGIPIEPLSGENHIEIITTLMKILDQKIQQGMQSGGMVPPQVLMGLNAISQQIAVRINLLAADPAEKEFVKQASDKLSKQMNELRAFGQRLKAAMQKNGDGAQGQMDPKDAAKIAGMQATSQQKVKQMRESHAARTAQRQIQFQQKIQQDAQQHQADLQKTDLEAASNIRRNRLTSTEE